MQQPAGRQRLVPRRIVRGQEHAHAHGVQHHQVDVATGRGSQQVHRTGDGHLLLQVGLAHVRPPARPVLRFHGSGVEHLAGERDQVVHHRPRHAGATDPGEPFPCEIDQILHRLVLVGTVVGSHGSDRLQVVGLHGPLPAGVRVGNGFRFRPFDLVAEIERVLRHVTFRSRIPPALLGAGGLHHPPVMLIDVHRPSRLRPCRSHALATTWPAVGSARGPDATSCVS